MLLLLFYITCHLSPGILIVSVSIVDKWLILISKAFQFGDQPFGTKGIQLLLIIRFLSSGLEGLMAKRDVSLEFINKTSFNFIFPYLSQLFYNSIEIYGSSW